MTTNRSRKPIPNLVQIPGENSGPVWQDGSENGYQEVRDAFIALLRASFPPIGRWEWDIPKVQRGWGAHIPCIPEICQTYPTGFDAPYCVMTPEQQSAANALYIETGKAIRAAYASGVAQGRNLLLGLAKGEVSLSDYDPVVEAK